MKDAKTLAYINLFAVLGTIPYLCDLDEEAAELIQDKSVSVGFAVKGGPEATLFFGCEDAVREHLRDAVYAGDAGNARP